jgi:Ca2+:H+ antiporter
LATVLTLATLSLVVPRFTTSEPGPEFSSEQLAFAAIASLVLYLSFVFVQTVRHREEFLDLPERSTTTRRTAGPTTRLRHGQAALVSLGLLLVALVAVVGLAKVESPAIEDAVEAIGAPQSAVGVVIAILVLAPEAVPPSAPPPRPHADELEPRPRVGDGEHRPDDPGDRGRRRSGSTAR